MRPPPSPLVFPVLLTELPPGAVGPLTATAAWPLARGLGPPCWGTGPPRLSLAASAVLSRHLRRCGRGDPLDSPTVELRPWRGFLLAPPMQDQAVTAVEMAPEGPWWVSVSDGQLPGRTPDYTDTAAWTAEHVAGLLPPAGARSGPSRTAVTCAHTHSAPRADAAGLNCTSSATAAMIPASSIFKMEE